MNAYTPVSSIPQGYRWATEEETENWWWDANIPRMVQVIVGYDNFSDPMTDFAIKEERV